MGRRSRKRAAQPSQRRAPTPRPDGERAAPRPLRSRRQQRLGEPPAAPWGKFPLVELAILVALVIGIAGFATGGPRGGILLATAAALGSLAGLELSIREHLAGYRSHTLVLASTVAVVVVAVMFFAQAPRAALLVVGAAVFATAFFALRELFKRRSGGYGFRG